jgi:hypothetical protein
MANPSNSDVQNLLPVQAYFNLDGSFNTFIGQGVPFTATISPNQSGLNITNSTINSTTIGASVPSTGVFTNIATTTGTITTAASGPTDIVNKQYVDYFAAGLSWKAPALTATSANITLSGLQTINGVTLVAGDTVLVKDQTNPAQNGIYIASATAWTYSVGGDTWNEYIGAIIFIASGSLGGTAWYCTAQPGGTLGVTAMIWSNFSVSSTYTAGTGLTLTGTVFSITNTGVSATTYGSATTSAVVAVNAQGQITSASSSTITPAVGSITGLGTGVATALAAGVTGSGNIVLATSPSLVTPILGTPTSGDFSSGTFTWPTFNQNTTGTAAKATNLVGGAAGSLPYQSALDTTTFLTAGTNGQVLTLASGVPSWATPTTGTVTSVSGSGTVSGISLSGTVTSSGSLTLGGTLDLSAPPAIGNTTANTIRGTTVTATTGFVGTNFDASGSGGGFLRSDVGGACLQWGGAGGVNVTVNGPINMNGANSAIQISPTGTGTVAISPVGALTVNPTTASTMNNVAIGGTTALAGTFTDLRVNGTISLAGSTGTNGYVLTSTGATAPTWQALPSSGLTITDDTTTNATRYLAFTSATSGTITGQNVASTKLQFNPSSGILTSTGFVGALNGTVGATTASTGAFTTLGATGVATFSAGSVSAPAITTTGDTNTGIFFPAADTIAFTEGGTEIMRLNSDGNVGIGTSSPSGKLTVTEATNDARVYVIATNASRAALLDLQGTVAGYNFLNSTTNGTLDWKVGGGAGAGVLTFCTGSSGTERMRIDSSGNISLGNASSSGNTSVFQSPGSLYLTLNTNGTLSGQRRNWSVSPEYDVAGGLSFLVGATEGAAPSSTKMIITAGGDLLVGTTTSSAKLTVSSASADILNLVTSGTAGGYIYTSASASNSNAAFFIKNGNGVGSIVCTSVATVYNTASDYRLKENITPMTGALATVAQLKPVTYKWKINGSDGQGFIAHELQEIAPYAVTGEKDGEQMQGVDYGKITPLLTAALQEALVKIELLEARLAVLESK